MRKEYALLWSRPGGERPFVSGITIYHLVICLVKILLPSSANSYVQHCHCKQRCRLQIHVKKGPITLHALWGMVVIIACLFICMVLKTECGYMLTLLVTIAIITNGT